MLKHSTSPCFAFIQCFVCICCLLAGNSLSAASEIGWSNDYETSVQRAATSNRVLMLHFYTDNCPPCRLLEKKTFHDPALIDAINENVVPTRINADHRRDLATKFNVTRWPTDIYLFPNGDEIYRGVSDQDPSVYSTKIKRIALRHRDWSVEREVIAKSSQRRQDQAIAANTPQIQAEKPVYYGNAGHPVKSQSTTWAQSLPPIKQSVNQTANTPVQTSLNSSFASSSPTSKRIIDNPYISQPPINNAERFNNATPPSIDRTSTGPDNSSVANSEQRIEPTTTLPPVVAKKTIPAQPVGWQLTQPQPQQPQPQPQPQPQQPQPQQPQQLQQPQLPQPQLQPPQLQQQQTIQPQSQPQTQLPPQQPSPENQNDAKFILAETIGTGGFCPVALIESIEQSSGTAWIAGSSKFAVRHRGRVYYCSSERARKVLLSNPDKYTPGLSGFDLVHFFKTGKLIDGNCKFGCVQPTTQRIFLFATIENYQEFEREMENYTRLLERVTPERVANRSTDTPIR
ncbi:MAG: thioredoxin family protein [Pirellula sp.]